MQQLSVKQVFDLIQAIAPFDTQEDFDNAGFLVGNAEAEVRGILIALDATPRVVEESQRLGANLIVAHHPLMFRGTKRLLANDFEGALLQQLIKADMNLLSAHTNLDRSELAAGKLILERLGCANLRLADDYVWLGDLAEPVKAGSLARKTADAIGAKGMRVFGNAEAEVTTLGVAGGAYDEGYLMARAAGAQAYLTGEVRHHNALAAAESGFVILDGGHFATEQPMVEALANRLQSELSTLQWSVAVYASTTPSSADGYAPKEEE